jgi:hypothetical protein
MAFLFANNASSVLVSDIESDDTQIELADASAFPEPVNPDVFVATLRNVATGEREIIYCTARAADVLTVVRAQEGTIAQAFPAGAEVAMVLTAAILEAMSG